MYTQITKQVTETVRIAKSCITIASCLTSDYSQLHTNHATQQGEEVKAIVSCNYIVFKTACSVFLYFIIIAMQYTSPIL